MKHKKQINAVVLVICVAMAFFIRNNRNTREPGSYPVTSMALTLTQMAVPMAAVEPKNKDIVQEPNREDVSSQEQQKTDQTSPPPLEAEDVENEEPQEIEKEPESEPPQELQIADSVKSPQVLIYHTHTTESYQPVTEGNFHSVNKIGTVREVGDVLAERLEELGYQVIHDETIHDHPSYSQSYSRSLETAMEYLHQYPEIALVVDLHRDAAGYAGSVGKVHSIEGKNSAAYGYVIGHGNPNLEALMKTVEDLNRIADQV
ncbi:MAG: stage II sporulation protein P, partial [Firmicutes bacterium]|nr:stage II sporulation protein P [Bacillota bacterium]